ncbi:hypothetical protein LC613_04145 [Nostoc sphaeroides CHAB 2801]|uniref:hypothetical protein n=1 Tax=Nostoc sphaeroides TaxID=446679 RepID=UPI0015F33BA2|nr:hypothetical protein [Nostoc sphaeroides]MCC5627393.1 hypothetical protein [Nostoc sphaeroides CHAB 2801]
MITNPQEEPILPARIETNDFNEHELFNRYLKTEDADIANLIPFQKEIKLEEKQE